MYVPFVGISSVKFLETEIHIKDSKLHTNTNILRKGIETTETQQQKVKNINKTQSLKQKASEENEGVRLPLMLI